MKNEAEVIHHADGRAESGEAAADLLGRSPLDNEALAPAARRDWLEDFKSQCERNLARGVEERMRYGFCYVYKPVLDDADWRSFASTSEYRRWCRDNLPVYLGYGAPDQLQARILDEGQ